MFLERATTFPDRTNPNKNFWMWRYSGVEEFGSFFMGWMFLATFYGKFQVVGFLVELSILDWNCFLSFVVCMTCLCQLTLISLMIPLSMRYMGLYLNTYFHTFKPWEERIPIRNLLKNRTSRQKDYPMIVMHLNCRKLIQILHSFRKVWMSM
mgnify:CR=1 FL=1